MTKRSAIEVNPVVVYSDSSARYSIPLGYESMPSALKILEDLFEACNAGSGRESKWFLALRCRSLSVGDFVNIGSDWYRCESFSWSLVPFKTVHDAISIHP